MKKIYLPKNYDQHSYFMKFGLHPNYWHEYIFRAYSNYQYDAIFLTGIPGIKDSLAHGHLYRDLDRL